MSGEEGILLARVLVVDDDLGVRQMLATFLRGEGHEVRTAADGQAALDILAESSRTSSW
jgi:CheY-like chemotaxis protein